MSKLKRRRQTSIDTRIRIWRRTSPRVKASPAEFECTISMHAPVHAVDCHLTLQLELCRCHGNITYVLGCLKCFCWVQGRCCLAQADQASKDSTTNTTSGKNMFVVGRRRSSHAMRTATLTLLVEAFRACPTWDFFFGNHLL